MGKMGHTRTMLGDQWDAHKKAWTTGAERDQQVGRGCQENQERKNCKMDSLAAELLRREDDFPTSSLCLPWNRRKSKAYSQAVNVQKRGHQVLPKLGKPCFFLGPAAVTRQSRGSEQPAQGPKKNIASVGVHLMPSPSHDRLGSRHPAHDPRDNSPSGLAPGTKVGH